MYYSNGIIYKIICNLDDKIIYIGSTFNSLKQRWGAHKCNYKHKYSKLGIHEHFDKYGIDNFEIVFIKSYNVVRLTRNDHKHLSVYEMLWVKRVKNACNLISPFNPLWDKRGKKEYHQKYNIEKKTEISQKKKTYYQKNKEKILIRTKIYSEANKEKISITNKAYYKKNKKKKNEKINCVICDRISTKNHLSRHMGSVKCRTIKLNKSIQINIT